jgi:hypothetical protein
LCFFGKEGGKNLKNWGGVWGGGEKGCFGGFFGFWGGKKKKKSLKIKENLIKFCFCLEGIKF